MKSIRSLFFILIFLPVSLFAQLSAFTSFQNQFMVWDDGMIRKVEYLVPLQVKIGRSAIAYIDNSRNFKIYSQGSSKKINDGFTSNFQVTDNLVTYQNARALYVWENGKTKLLTNYFESYKTADSLVVFFDGMRKEFKAYYNGNIYNIENFMAGYSADRLLDSVATISDGMNVAGGQLPSLQVSDNVAAYVNFANAFKVFYQGKIESLEEYLIQSFGVGRNTVAYVDGNMQFKVFQNGNVRVLSEFTPYSYAVGDDLVAYVSNDNYFNIFYQDSVYNIGYFEPEFRVKDNVVAFRDQSGYLVVFYKGNLYPLENYYPSNLNMGYNSVAYVDRANVLRQFCAGKKYEITNASISDWQMDYDVVMYNFGNNMFKIFYQGKTY